MAVIGEGSSRTERVWPRVWDVRKSNGVEGKGEPMTGPRDVVVRRAPAAGQKTKKMPGPKTRQV
jgi:hypothetical protein